MQIESISKRVVTDDEGKVIDKGCVCNILIGDFPIVASFVGLTQRGALGFKGLERFEDVNFAIMPKSIKEIYVQNR